MKCAGSADLWTLANLSFTILQNPKLQPQFGNNGGAPVDVICEELYGRYRRPPESRPSGSPQPEAKGFESFRNGACILLSWWHASIPCFAV